MVERHNGRNALDDWRLANGLTYEALGKLIGCDRSVARRYCLPREHYYATAPRRDRMRRVIEITGGAVTASSLLGLEADGSGHD